nr:MAG TPA: hypothetical protein [Caudoviricetes sp.]
MRAIFVREICELISLNLSCDGMDIVRECSEYCSMIRSVLVLRILARVRASCSSIYTILTYPILTYPMRSRLRPMVVHWLSRGRPWDVPFVSRGCPVVVLYDVGTCSVSPLTRLYQWGFGHDLQK